MDPRRASVARPGAVRAAADEEVEEELMMIEESAVSAVQPWARQRLALPSLSPPSIHHPPSLSLVQLLYSAAHSPPFTALALLVFPTLPHYHDSLRCNAVQMERMEKTLDSVRGNFNTVRTGRASPSLLDRIEVEYYGTNVILKSIAQIATPDASMLLVTPFDKSSIPSIEKAIMKSDVGLTPSSDGNVIRLSIPQLTAERRKELLKTVSKLSEDGKVALRNVRRDSIKAYEKLQKEKKISEDALKDLSNDIQVTWHARIGQHYPPCRHPHIFLTTSADSPLPAPSCQETHIPEPLLLFTPLASDTPLFLYPPSPPPPLPPLPLFCLATPSAPFPTRACKQKMTDDYVKQIDTAFKQKEKVRATPTRPHICSAVQEAPYLDGLHRTTAPLHPFPSISAVPPPQDLLTV
ncbi:unnamed protein product [Closterium sp. Naga37s-1]|nr:unnamed protein product [Closterium sp. Naga37s-1]